MSSLQDALLSCGLKVSNEPPIPGLKVNQSAILAVNNPLPVPTVCPHCGSKVSLVNNSEIYGKPYGVWPYAYRCDDDKDGDECDSYVGLHQYTLIPLGTLATAHIRSARKQAKEAFNPLWQERHMDRSSAYKWLANALQITRHEECHIGWFDSETCMKVVQLCREKRNELQSSNV